MESLHLAMRFSARTQPPTLGNSPRSSPRKSRTCEAVDLQRLPGLQTLWEQHDLNVQGDASHFVNTLWLATQSRAFTYRYAEIQPGGFLKDHIQKMPIHIDFPAHCPDEVHFQERGAMKVWGSISWMRREPSDTEVDGLVSTAPSPCPSLWMDSPGSKRSTSQWH